MNKNFFKRFPTYEKSLLDAICLLSIKPLNLDLTNNPSFHILKSINYIDDYSCATPELINQLMDIDCIGTSMDYNFKFTEQYQKAHQPLVELAKQKYLDYLKQK